VLIEVKHSDSKDTPGRLVGQLSRITSLVSFQVIGTDDASAESRESLSEVRNWLWANGRLDSDCDSPW
jgi:hypothetical protein